jgi:hypothetical protein
MSKPCRSCGRPMEGRTWGAKNCFDCHRAMRHAWRESVNAMAKARLTGLPPARTFQCVDCGKPATAYDHRDYFRPLDVEPVCTRCNFHRGSAVQLQAGAIEHIDLTEIEGQAPPPVSHLFLARNAPQ